MLLRPAQYAQAELTILQQIYTMNKEKRRLNAGDSGLREAIHL
jgi:hypothetical protein